MSRTVTALYDTRAEAEAARERLDSAVDVESQARIIEQTSSDSGSSDLKDVPMSDDDRALYGESLRRGGFMLCAEVDDDEDCDKIVSILEETSSVDLDDRQNAWRKDGWAGVQANASSDRSNIVEEERIPVIEEQLRVGKREVERGGARVRSYVEERPVSESINLREEHVNVERRAVDQPISAANLDNDLLRDREIEMRETTEEAVVGKEARVKEEVVLQKTASERTQNVEDTVRETKVEVDDDIEPRDR